MAAHLPLPLSFHPDSYRRASALVAAFGFADEPTVIELLDGADRDLVSVLLLFTDSALVRFSEAFDTSIEEELQELGWAAAAAAAEEES